MQTLLGKYSRAFVAPFEMDEKSQIDRKISIL